MDDKMKNMGMAYEIRKRNAAKKKFAKGGSVEEGPSEKENQSGVNKIIPNYDKKYSEVKHGQSEARYGSTEERIAKHKDTLAELKAMPKPKTQRLAMGGMAQSSVIKSRPLDKYGTIMEEERQMSEMPPKKYEGMSEDRGPEKKEYLSKQMSQMLAEGGKVDGAKTSTGGAKTSTTGNKTKTGGSNPGGASTGGAGTVTITTRDLGAKGINVSNVGGKTDSKNHGGMGPGDEDDDGKTMLAEGGEVDYGQDEQDEEQHSSIAAAIMAQRERKMMAEGGEVALDDKEEDSDFESRNEGALKENYDEDMTDVTQPEDSNMHSDDISEDEHDMISKIRAKMRMKMAK